MLRVPARPLSSSWKEAVYFSTRLSSAQPPKPRDFKPNLSRDAIDREPEHEVIQGSSPSQAKEPKDIARGIEASRQAVLTGKLDPRYRDAARKVTMLICATPLFLYLSYELYRRQFLGVKQKEIPSVPSKDVPAP